MKEMLPGSQATSRNERFRTTTTKRDSRVGGGGGNPVRCNGKQCRSCTGGAVADCVALCCCPCAVLDCLALVFIRIPYLIGKRWCLGFRRRRRRRRKNKKAKELAGSEGGGGGDRGGAESLFEIGLEEEGGNGRTSERHEGGGGRGWVEVYEFDHLSFGRVSFTGIP